MIIDEDKQPKGFSWNHRVKLAMFDLNLNWGNVAATSLIISYICINFTDVPQTFISLSKNMFLQKWIVSKGTEYNSHLKMHVGLE